MRNATLKIKTDFREPSTLDEWARMQRVAQILVRAVRRVAREQTIGGIDDEREHDDENASDLRDLRP